MTGKPRLVVLSSPSCRVCHQETGTAHAPSCEFQRVAEIVGLPEPPADPEGARWGDDGSTSGSTTDAS